MLPTRLTRGVQNLHRLQHIARVLTQHGFGHIVDQLDLGRFVPLWLRKKSESQPEGAPLASVGKRLRTVATELGPIFVKLGQMLAGRPDIVPPEILTELQTLQDRVEPFDSDAARRIVSEELGVPVGEAFSFLDDKPMAAGSIGQVYRATLPDGLSVMVKVRRPGIEQNVRNDIDLLNWLADALERWVPEARPYRPKTLVEEFERAILAELDYMHEAATTARLREAFAGDEDIEIPEVVWSHTTRDVLTLGALDGDNLQRALQKQDPELDRKRLAVRLADVFLKQFLDIGMFHADPHPGNILVKPPARIGLIDFGQAGFIGDDLIGHLLLMLIGAVNRDMDVLIDALSEMDALGPDTDTRQLARDLSSLNNKYHGQPMERLHMATIFAEVAETIRRHDISVPRDVMLMLKSLTTIWGVTLRLDPEMDLVALLRPRLSRMMRRRLAPSRLLKSGGMTAWHLMSVLKSGPGQLRQLLRTISSGKWQLNVRHENLDRLVRDLDRSSNRLSFAIVIAGLVVGSSTVVTANPQIEVLGVPLQTLGVAGYLIAAILGLGLLWSIFRSGRLS